MIFYATSENSVAKTLRALIMCSGKLEIKNGFFEEKQLILWTKFYSSIHCSLSLCDP